MIKISIIVPVYNVEKHVSKCIESILSQSYTAIELILVDDGSTDQSGCICEVFAVNDPRVKVIHQKRQGVSGARNIGLDIAQGDYIGFVDSDDYIDPNMYKIMLQTIQKYDADIVSCKTNIVSESGEFLSNLTSKCGSLSKLNHIEALSAFCSSVGQVISNSTCDKLFKASIIKTIRFDPKISMSEDCLFVCEALFNAQNFILIPDQLYYYVNREGSAMHSKFSYKNLEAIEALKKCVILYEKNEPNLAMMMKNTLLTSLLNILISAFEAKTSQNIKNKICNELNMLSNLKYNGRFNDRIKHFTYYKLKSIKLMLIFKKIRKIITRVQDRKIK